MACYTYVGTTEVEIPCTDWYAVHAAQVAETEQQGSQFWMNYDYNLTPETEPSLEVKALYSSADYARDWVTMRNLAPIVGPGAYPVPSSTSVLMYGAAQTGNLPFIETVTEPFQPLNVSQNTQSLHDETSGSTDTLTSVKNAVQNGNPLNLLILVAAAVTGLVLVTRK